MRKIILQLALFSIVLFSTPSLFAQSTTRGSQTFVGSERCIACHSGIHDASGHDVSIGYSWRASMMANSGRDPYWLASVRREVMEHPQAQEAIEDKCATCHLPAARWVARSRGQQGKVFQHYDDSPPDSELATLAKDGVTCSVCHQITQHGLGDTVSFTGGFNIDSDTRPGERPIYGPHDVDAGRSRIMNSASQFVPQQADHMARSELCATCHTLYTHALDEEGEVVGELPEQVPFLEWKHSLFSTTQSCQDCHMPVLEKETPITSVLREPRPAFSQHVFRGGNAFMLRMLNRFRDELGVTALPSELEATASRTEEYLQTHTAELAIESVVWRADILEIGVRVTNLAGHKLPTAYPSRRAWLHVRVMDAAGDLVFESGALNSDGSIVGNDSDVDPDRYEPHYVSIESGEQVQIYEPIMVDHADRVTTGLISGVRYIKDNRLLPQGFDKHSAPADVSVLGQAMQDHDFTAAGDTVIYRVDGHGRSGPLTITAALRYQTIGHRWAMNLARYDTAEEPRRFVRYYRSAAADSAITLASATMLWDRVQP